MYAPGPNPLPEDNKKTPYTTESSGLQQYTA